MKSIFKTVIASVLGFMALVSCERTDDLAVLEFKASPVLDVNSFSSSSYVVREDNLSNTFETIMFTSPVYTQATEVESQLQVAVAGTGFAQPVDLGAPTSTNYVRVSYSQLNSALLSLGLKAGEASSVEIRVKSNVKDRSNNLLEPSAYSNYVSIVVTPYLSGPSYLFTDLYLIGSATAAGWNNAADNTAMYPLLKMSNLPDVYTYTGYFKGGEGFKIVQVKGSWDLQYGLGASAGQLSKDGGSGDIKVAQSGYYELTINTTDLTYTFTPVAAPSATYSTVGIIGSATSNGWDKSTPMVQSSFDPHVWVLTGVSLKDGELKFRANDSWDVNWGSSTEYFGTATFGGNNIPVSTAWTYDIYFNDATGDYTIIPSK